jgi:hypothetical protein
VRAGASVLWRKYGRINRQALTRCAFVDTNPTDKPITSDLPVIHPESTPSAEITSYNQTYRDFGRVLADFVGLSEHEHEV